MNRRWYRYRGMSLVLIRATLLGIMLLGFSSVGFAADYQLIANKDISIESLSKEDVQAIFLGERTQWDDGSHITFTIMDHGGFHKSFLRDVIGKTQSQFDAYWMRLVFAGKAQAPTPFSEVNKMIEFIASHPGAIGYIPSTTVDNSVKTIAIQ